MSEDRPYHFGDNVGVRAGRVNEDRGEFFAIYLNGADKRKLDDIQINEPPSAVLCRYGVPGRCSVYRFSTEPDHRGRLTFDSEYGTVTLGKAATMAALDLNKRQVVDLFSRAFDQVTEVNWPFIHYIITIVDHIAPQSQERRLVREHLSHTPHRRSGEGAIRPQEQHSPLSVRDATRPTLPRHREG